MPLKSVLKRGMPAASIAASIAMCFASSAHAADCAECATIMAKYEAAGKDEAAANKLLAANRAMLATLSPSDISKKVKISSNILILTAKSEKAGNDKAIIQQDFNAKGCQTCPR